MVNPAESSVFAPPSPERLARTTREALWLTEGDLRAGDLTRAESRLERILDREPQCPEAWFFLGVIRQHQKRSAEAADHYLQALTLAPELAEGHNNLSVILQGQGKFLEAEARCREAISLMPDYAEAYNNLGNVLQDQGRFEDAVLVYRQALDINPRDVEALKHLGNALRALGRPAEAIACYDAGLRLAPGHVLLHMARAMVWIQMGDFAHGWTECEWRLRGQDSPIPRFPQPVWDGRPLEGQTILIHAEQGLGDTLQFIRYAPMVAGRGGRVIVACSPLLKEILRRCPGVSDVVIPGERLPEFACYAPVMSLPRIFGSTLDTIPATVPYLNVDPARLSFWRQELSAC